MDWRVEERGEKEGLEGGREGEGKVRGGKMKVRMNR